MIIQHYSQEPLYKESRMFNNIFQIKLVETAENIRIMILKAYIG